jgi:hypothetical protein
MPTIYFQTTQNLLHANAFILKHSKIINSDLADNLFRKKLYETPKKDIPALIDYHYRRCDEPLEFADHVIELLEVALDENEEIKFLKSMSFWGDPEKAKRYKRRTAYALEYLRKLNDPEANEANIIRLPFNGEKVVLADMFRQLIELELPDGSKAVPLNSKDMARCLIGITESFKESKLNTVYDYFRNPSGRMDKRTFPKKYRIKVSVEEI